MTTLSFGDYLIKLERKYSAGQVTRGITPWEPSPLDPKGAPQRIHDGHRMSPKLVGLEHHYAPIYALYLESKRQPVNTLVEMGVLRGIGLAIWCDVYPLAQIIGLDVDLSHWRARAGVLHGFGAFSMNAPIVLQFDELADDAAASLQVQTPGGIDVFIDDALHYDAAIVQAFDKFWPLINPGGLYFIEDNENVFDALRIRHPDVRFHKHKEMTVAVKP